MEIEASNAMRSSTGVEGALDVDIEVADAQFSSSGGVTMVIDRINGGWRAYGDTPDTWVESGLLHDLRAIGPEYCKAALQKIEDAAREVCEEYRKPAKPYDAIE